MAVTYVTAVTLGTVAVNPPTLNLTLPTFASGNLAVDDIIVIHVMSKILTVPANEINTPSGYTEKGTKTDIDAVSSADDMRTAMFYKRAVSGDDGATVTVSRAGSSTTNLAAIAYIFRGALASGDPFDAAGIAIGAGDITVDTDIDFPAFDPAADRHVVYFAWHADDSTTTPTNISNGGFTFTIRNEQESSVGSDNTAMIWSADHDGTSLGAVVKSFTSTGGTSIGYVYALIPATTGTTLTPSAVTAAWSIAVPTVVKGGVLKTPSPVTAAWSVVTPTVVKGGVLKTPSPVVVSWSVVTPNLLRGGVVKTPSPVIASYSTPTPTVTNESGAVLTPSPVVAVYAVIAPTVIRGGLTLTPAVVQALFGVVAPTIIKGGRVLIPTSVQVFFTVPPPIVTGGTPQVQDISLYFRYN